jgi:hypothetical protein
MLLPKHSGQTQTYPETAAHDEEERCIDVATVPGYRQVVMCQEVRDEIEAVIGAEASVKDILLAMCNKRLLPTPWLNQVRPALSL